MKQNNVVRLDEVRDRKQFEKLHLEIIVVDEIQRLTAGCREEAADDGSHARLRSTREPFSFEDEIASVWKISGGMVGIASKASRLNVVRLLNHDRIYTQTEE